MYIWIAIILWLQVLVAFIPRKEETPGEAIWSAFITLTFGLAPAIWFTMKFWGVMF